MVEKKKYTMTKDLFGRSATVKREIKLKLFCDESGSKEWLYIGILIVPDFIEAVLLRALLNERCGNPSGDKIWGTCKPVCRYHNKNNTEVHFTEVEKSKNKFFVAERWIDYLLGDKNNIFFYILGIDMQKLDRSYFGDRPGKNIYNRFFRTAILKSVKSYFHKYASIVIEQVYHDSSRGLETNTYFPWHSIFYIDSRDDKVSFASREIKFIDSDHKKSGNTYSHFIQFIDLLLGCIHNCLDYTSGNPDKEALAMKSLDLIGRLIEKPNNKNSTYKYFGRQKIEFFPKHDLAKSDKDILEYQYKRMASFYHKRILRIKDKNQMSLLELQNV